MLAALERELAALNTDVGIVQTQYATWAEPLRLKSGVELAPITLAYETYGALNSQRDNAVLVMHALSGLVHASANYALLVMEAANATVRGLVLDGNSAQWPVYAINGAGWGGPNVSNVAITGNQITCGWSGCVFVVGVSSSVVSNNRLEARHRAGTGIHLQAFNPAAKYLMTDDARIEDNVVTALVPVGSFAFGAIRPRDGSDMVVRGNRVVGPWSNGIAMAEVRNSVFERNVVEGATRSGLFFASNPFSPVSVSGSLYRANEMTSLNGPTAFLQKACGNVLVGNRFTAPANVPTVAFARSTGSNELLGSSAGVEDNGDFDCDGDGVSDPNGITGKTHKGGHSGDVIAPAMQLGGRAVH